METNVCYQGDCLDVLKTLPENSVDSIVTDPPAGISFMSKGWDSDKGGRDNWIEWMSNIAKECLRVLKPGGHAFVWALPRTTHWTATAWENGGFEPRDVVAHVFGSGFPKSHNIGKSVDKLQGNEREIIGTTITNKTVYQNIGGINISGEIEITKGTSAWEGWGTALKPAREDWWLMRKPLEKGLSIAENCLKWGTGGINIDESRVGTDGATKRSKHAEYPKNEDGTEDRSGSWARTGHEIEELNLGRFPANLIHDNSEEVRECFPESKSSKGSFKANDYEERETSTNFTRGDFEGRGDSGNASRFFKSIIYQAKASKSERNKGCEGLEQKVRIRQGLAGEHKDTISSNSHPTVKPIALMEYLIKMITPKGGIVLDPFAGSGSTLVAARDNGFQYVGIELTEEYLPIIQARTGCEIIKPKDKEFVKLPGQDKFIKELIKNTDIDIKDKPDKCPCGGKIVTLKSGVRTCEDCLIDY